MTHAGDHYRDLLDHGVLRSGQRVRRPSSCRDAGQDEGRQSALEVSLVKQFVGWKDEVLAAINGKYVSAQLIAEIRASLGREMTGLSARMDHMEKRCEDRPKDCIALRCHPPE